MKLITKDTDYAIRALKRMARQDKEAYSVAFLAREMSLPKPFLRKILQKLAAANLLNSYKGRGGGFTLAGNADDMYVTQVMRVFQGKFSLIDCLFQKQVCPSSERCVLRQKIQSLQQMVKKELEQISIGQLEKEETNGQKKDYKN